ncbi:hypothetical protein QJV38_00355 [Listeria cossartiae subsp. cayugensis]|uniref:Glycosaminoglycan attachment site n=1 Tax=Listeria cossartiae subsp. cayugensis TaxID=2713505 RepID=A0ABU2INJ0_9LIST|nr:MULTISPECIES: hypothetical protein [Listeria]MBF2477872.1 hypothetical protein [Listeria marthii]MBF2494505.1 hypothetical protein [Listeria marthii]MDT0049413.1 hypothetical protein [Listeria cossartiae subsp. cayugensis]MDT0065916.1 hypothetical protein [Listeria cossartiae subsp. cayugensis]MDT0078480.1 hypothetical protein [Listeria cossartiae subsp. cayugensis]
MDFFTPVVKKDKLHHNFIHLASNQYLKKVLNEWGKGFQDRDGKFVKEFQMTFNSSFWELYLYALLSKKSLTIDFSHEAPDFIVVDEEKQTKYIIEATIASNALNRPAEWQQEEKIEFLTKEHSTEEIKKIKLEATVRICNSVSSKHTKYKSGYNSLDYVKDKPFIVALASFDSFLFYKYGVDPILRALYGVDDIFYDYKGEVVEKVIDKIEKDNGAEIRVGLFRNDEFKEISAILYSCTATYGKLEAMSCRKNKKNLIFSTMKYNDYGTEPIVDGEKGEDYEETLSDGLYLFLNPFAVNPLSQDDIHDLSDSKTSIFYDANNNKMEHGFLFVREVLRIKRRNKDKNV